MQGIATRHAAICNALQSTILSALIIGFPGRLPAESGISPVPSTVSAAESRAYLPLDINSADADALAERLPGVGPVKAARIVAYRQQHGPFTTVDELVAVPGIGPVTLERIREFLTNGGSVKRQSARGLAVDAQPLSTTEQQARTAVQALKALALRDAQERGTGALDW